MIGSRQEIARSLIDTYHVPMASRGQDDLAQVASYLAFMKSMHPATELQRVLGDEVWRRYGDAVAHPWHDGDGLSPNQLDDLLAEARAWRWQQNLPDTYRELAEFPFPLYITASPDNQLAVALRAAGKMPRVELFPWHDGPAWPLSVYDHEPWFRPTLEEPLVYHFFGHFAYPDSLVLTEDDYENYLTGLGGHSAQIPTMVRRALADTPLFFLGFRVEDRDLRVLLRHIMNQPGGARRKHYAHLAVQVDPEDDRTFNAELARRYVTSLFQGADVSVYWGKPKSLPRRNCGTIRSNSRRSIPGDR